MRPPCYTHCLFRHVTLTALSALNVSRVHVQTFDAFGDGVAQLREGKITAKQLHTAVCEKYGEGLAELSQEAVRTVGEHAPTQPHTHHACTLSGLQDGHCTTPHGFHTCTPAHWTAGCVLCTGVCSRAACLVHTHYTLIWGTWDMAAGRCDGPFQSDGGAPYMPAALPNRRLLCDGSTLRPNINHPNAVTTRCPNAQACMANDPQDTLNVANLLG